MGCMGRRSPGRSGGRFRWARPDAGAGKLAVLAPDVLAPDAWWLPRAFRWRLQARLAAGALCIQDADPSAERSFAAAALPAGTGALEAAGLEATAGGCAGGAAGRGGVAVAGCWPKLAEPPVELPVEAQLEPRAQPIEEEPALER